MKIRTTPMTGRDSVSLYTATRDHKLSEPLETGMARTVGPSGLLIRPLFQEESFGTVEYGVTLDSRQPLVLRCNSIAVSSIERGSLGGI